MLNDFTWNMTGYIPKYQVNPHGDGIIPYVAERIFLLYVNLFYAMYSMIMEFKILYNVSTHISFTTPLWSLKIVPSSE